MESMNLRPALRPYMRAFGALAVLLVLASFLGGALEGEIQLVALSLIVLAGLLALGWLGIHYYSHISNLYSVSENEIIRVAGIWVKDEYHVPISKIQDYKVNRSYVGELLGVADLGVQTGRAERGFEIILQSIHEKDLPVLEQMLSRVSRPRIREPI
jgi:uncharacterized membrane protein YdbT with pleckstrin-like domain